MLVLPMLVLTAFDCPALNYERVLRGVLHDDDRHALQRVFHARHGYASPTKRYWTLLMKLASTPVHDPLWAAVRRVQARIAHHFGPQFAIVNDFFSWRHSDDPAFAPAWHADHAFWYVDGCRGFNLWIIIHSEGGYNHSFDVLETSRNEGMYRKLYSDDSMATPPPHATIKAQLMLNGNATMACSADGTHCRLGQDAISRFRLHVGDAMVLRQPEIHRTDKGDLASNEARLAIGFKVIERRSIIRPHTAFGNTAWMNDYQQANRSMPCLLPSIDLGQEAGSPYDTAFLEQARAVQPECVEAVDRVVKAWGTEAARTPHR